MQSEHSERQRILGCLGRFLRSTGRQSRDLSDSTHLVNELGLTSDEGVDFALDLCDEFKLDFPGDFNPFIHSGGRRGLRVGEMVKTIVSHLPAQVKEAVL